MEMICHMNYYWQQVAIPLAKNVLAPLGIAAAASAIDAGIQEFKKKYMVLETQL